MSITEVGDYKVSGFPVRFTGDISLEDAIRALTIQLTLIMKQAMGYDKETTGEGDNPRFYMGQKPWRPHSLEVIGSEQSETGIEVKIVNRDFSPWHLFEFHNYLTRQI